jgi:hypothetical protein
VSATRTWTPELPQSWVNAWRAQYLQNQGNGLKHRNPTQGGAGIDRAQMLSLLVDACNRTIAMGIERHQGAVVIGAVRTLNDLLALGADTRQQRNQWN